MKTYLKMCSVDDINEYIKKNGIDKTTDIIENEKNIPFFIILNTIMPFLSDFIYFTGTTTDKILLGLAMIIGLNIYMKQSGMRYNIYYMNDFETAGDLYLYFVLDSYTGDITKLNTDTTILSFIPGTTQFSLNRTYKMALYKLIEFNIINKIKTQLPSGQISSSKTLTTSSPEYINYKNLIIKKQPYLSNILSLKLAGLYCYFNNKNAFTTSSPILTEIREFNNSMPDDVRDMPAQTNNDAAYKMIINLASSS
jgi:hypothetical protein